MAICSKKKKKKKEGRRRRKRKRKRKKKKGSWSQVIVQTSCQWRQPSDGRISKPARDGIRVLETTLTSKTCKLLVKLLSSGSKTQPELLKGINDQRAIFQNVMKLVSSGVGGKPNCFYISKLETQALIWKQLMTLWPSLPPYLMVAGQLCI